MLERDSRYSGWSRPATWHIVNLTRCRACGEPVAFGRAYSGASSGLLDRDGTRHGLTCTEPERYALIMRQRR